MADRTRDQTTVHLIRHGEVHNPEGVLYGRRDGYHLSDLGREMAQRIAGALGDRDIVHLRTSPLERAQETAAPLAAALALTPVIDPRVIESGNVFEGKRFGHGDNALRKPSTWIHLRNAFNPSWGEASMYLLMAVVLLVRPRGLLGERIEKFE